MDTRTRGFSVIEMLVVVAIIGLLMVMSFPSILNTLETRSLESSAREVLTTVQAVKFQAVRTKLNHRLVFTHVGGTWQFVPEREGSPGVWTRLPGAVAKTIPPKFNVTVNLPSQIIAFTALGHVANYLNTQNTVTIQSDKLDGYNKDDQRTVSIFLGGSVQYAKSRST